MSKVPAAECVQLGPIINDVYDQRTFMKIEAFSCMTVFLACFPPAEPNVCHLFFNRSLEDLLVARVA